jgi:hypothetical protein
MDNISRISTHVWRKARSDVMAPHRAEAAAVRTMKELYAWGETVVRGFEGEDRGCDEQEGESESSVVGDEGDAGRIGGAAKRLCHWFGDEQASNVCEELAGELLDLKKKGQAGTRNASVDESSDGFANIL